MLTDVPGDLARPMQLISRDRYGKTIETLEIIGPNCTESGVCLIEGYSGFYHAARTQVDSGDGAYQEGAEPTPWPRVEKRGFKFTLGVQAGTPGDFEALETKLWRILTFHRDAVIRVYSVNSRWREAWRVRLAAKPNDLLARVPGVMKFAAWDIEATAYDPWWHSDLISHAVRKGDSTVQINPDTGAVSPGSGVYELHVPMLNPADVRCFPEFSCNTITANLKVWLPDGLTDRMVAINADDTSFTPGQEFLVQTNPLRPTLMVRDDTLAWAAMASRSFDSWIRPGKITPVSQRIWLQGGDADTQVTAYYPQSWDRMFGGETPPHLEDVEWTGVPDV